MENIGEILYCLVSFLMQGGPSGVLVLVASNKIVLFFNGILEGVINPRVTPRLQIRVSLVT
jgi:hypothetical protein